MSINRLTPSADTSFFAWQSVELFSNQKIGSSSEQGRITWGIDVYTYCTGAHPTDPEFHKKGRIFAICVHDGYVDSVGADIWNKMRFSLKPKADSGLVPSLQLPTTGSGSQVEDDYNYKINFAQNMPMFKNNGNETYTFEASYEDNFTRISSKQSGTRTDSVEFVINTTKPASDHRTTEIRGFSVFTSNNPTAFPVAIKAEFDISGSGITGGSWTASKDINLSLGF